MCQWWVCFCWLFFFLLIPLSYSFECLAAFWLALSVINWLCWVFNSLRPGFCFLISSGVIRAVVSTGVTAYRQQLLFTPARERHLTVHRHPWHIQKENESISGSCFFKPFYELTHLHTMRHKMSFWSQGLFSVQPLHSHSEIILWS